jgi:predicted ATP-binding protein involved in virulence
MQLISLYIKKYNHLEEFTIEFKEKLSVIIGINGSGKSSILEVLAQIFSAAYLNEKANFGFKLNYKLGTALVELSAKEGGEIIEMNGEDNINRQLLPNNVVVYYSGLSDKMEKLCKPHEDKQRDDFKNYNFSQRPLFYYRPENFKMFLLTLFAFQFGDTKDFLLKKIQLTSLNRFKIELKKPLNFKTEKTKSDKFWDLRGETRIFCDKLDEFSDNERIDKQSNNFIKYDFNSVEKLYAIRNFYSQEKQVFEFLDMLSYQGMLGELAIFVEKKGQILNSDTLSEGEKQVIAIRGINDLLINENTLLLFDEPDTYLHPSWQSKFMEEIIKYREKAQFVITSHSPNIISSLQKIQLNLLHTIDGKPVVKHVSINPYGKPVDQILIDFFGLKSLRNEAVTKVFEKLWQLIKNNNYKSDEFIKMFEQLEKEIGSDDDDLSTIRLEIARREKNEKNK